MIVSGTPGHVTEDQQHKRPYMHNGHLLRFSKPYYIYELTLQQSTGGTIAGAPVTGLAGTTFNLSATPANKYTFDGWSVTGTTLTGSAGTYTNSDVTVKGNWTYHPDSAYVKDVTGPLTINGTNAWGTLHAGNVVPMYYNIGDNEYIVLTGIRMRGWNLGSPRVTYRDDVKTTAWGLGSNWATMDDTVPASADPQITFSGKNVAGAHSSGSPIYVSAGTSDGYFSACWNNSYSAKWSGKLYRLE